MNDEDKEEAIKLAILLRMKAQDGLWIPGTRLVNVLFEAADMLEKIARQEKS